jgi:hypothetical protein
MDDDDDTRLILSALDWKPSEFAIGRGPMLPSGLKRHPGDSIFSLSREAIRLIPMIGDMLISDGRKNYIKCKLFNSCLENTNQWTSLNVQKKNTFKHCAINYLVR